MATADLHGALPDISDWPDADVLVLGGDTEFLELGTTRSRSMYEARRVKVNKWIDLANEKYENVVGIAGNHDFAMQADPTMPRTWLHWEYLCDQEIEINGFKFYGTPWSKTFLNWAFMQPDQDLAAVWAKIPDDTDVLIVHGPPQGLCDLVGRGEHVGSSTLRERLVKIQPKLVICGHIHEAAGVAMLGSTLVANVSWNGEAQEFRV